MAEIEQHRHASRNFWHLKSRVHTEDFSNEPCEERTVEVDKEKGLLIEMPVTKEKFAGIVLREIERETRLRGMNHDVLFDGWCFTWDPATGEYSYTTRDGWKVTKDFQVAVDAMYGSPYAKDLLGWFNSGPNIEELENTDWNPYANEWEYPDESWDDRDIYYDLVQLPNGGHIPAPFVDWDIVLREQIPTSGIVRDEEYFVCSRCGIVSFYKCHCYEEEEDKAEALAEQARQERKDAEFTDICDRKAWDELSYVNAV